MKLRTHPLLRRIRTTRPHAQSVLHQCSFQNGAAVSANSMSESATLRSVRPNSFTRTW